MVTLKSVVGTSFPMALALAMGIVLNSTQLHANKPIAGKNTNVSGVFICDCTSSENSCSCLV